ncbi:MAG: VWA domain-containing protein, partial [Planctomycetales bacterium]|nr:VWA domain-containing protein [Planctomycetales bacterium]
MKRALASVGSFLAILLLTVIATPAFGQGVLIIHHWPHPVPLPRPIPRPTPPPVSYKIKELSYQAKVKDQVAQVQVSQSFVNTGSAQMEVSFVFPLPYEGAIDRMTFMVDGKEYDAKLLPAKDARAIYESYVRRNQDPALLEWVGYGMFQTSVFPVPPGAERKVTLKFSQLLRKSGQLTDLVIPLATAKYSSTPVEKISIDASIETTAEMKSVYSPSHAINVQRPDGKHAIVKYEVTNQIPTTDFRLLFDTNDGSLGASVISYRPEGNDDGFFLLLASPEVKAMNSDRPAKTLIFVVDRSGSMSGKKIEQAKEALKFVLNNLRTGDMFNIVAYDSAVESFKPELQKYDDETRKAALAFVDGIYAGGSTNIDGAMTTALAMIKDDTRPNYVLFLTDGLPTAGETNEAKIAQNTKQNNKVRSRIISFGVGYDVNSRLLDRIARDNYGQSDYVRPDENIESSVGRLSSKMSSPVMTHVGVKVDVDAATDSGAPSINRMYPKEVYDIFAGDQLVIVGRYKKGGGAKVTINGKVGNEEKKFDFPASLIDKSNDQSFAFVEKLWAMRRIGEIIDEMDLKGKNDELVKELVGLSIKHGILTSYTSFLADENAKPSQLASSNFSSNVEATRRSLDRLEKAEGKDGVAQRGAKFDLQFAERAQSGGGAGFGGGKPGAAGGIPASAAPKMAAGGRLGGYGGAKFRDIDSDKEVAAGDSVQNVGNETLYKRGRTLYAANAQEVDPDKDDAK